MDAKRILILTADAGFGHRSAANAIAAALQELYAGRCVFEILNPLDDRRVPSVLRRQITDYDKIVQQMPDLYRFGYQASDSSVPSAIVESALIVMLYEVMRDLLRRHQPDAIITTYPLYQAPLSAVYTINRWTIPLLTVITDLATVHRLWFHANADVCLAPTPAVRGLALEAGLAPDKIQITGIPVHPRLSKGERDPAVLRAELGWRPDLSTVLAVGSKRVKHLPEALRALNHSGLPLQLVVVAGGDEALYRRLQDTGWHLPAYLYNFVEDMPTFMQAADCILCKAGGLIVTESLACGLPLLLVDVLPGQEAGNASYVIDGGAGELADEPLDALEVMCHWLERDGELLSQRARNARRLGRPYAAYDVAKLAWIAAQRGPRLQPRLEIPGRAKLVDLLDRYGILSKDRRQPGDQEFPLTE